MMNNKKDFEDGRKMSLSYLSICNQRDRQSAEKNLPTQFNPTQSKNKKSMLVRGVNNFRNSTITAPSLKSLKDNTPEQKSKRSSIFKTMFSSKSGGKKGIANSSQLITESDSRIGKYGSLGNLLTGIDVDKNMSKFNIVIVGNPDVGKTALAVRFLTGRYLGEYASGLNMTYTNQIRMGNEMLILKITDTTPENLKNYLDKADACLMVYSVTNEASSKAILHLLEKITCKIKEKTRDRLLLMVLGNKSDCKRGREVNEQTVKLESDKRNVEHLLVSAASNINVFETLDKIINVVSLRRMTISDVKGSAGSKIAQFKKFITSRKSKASVIEE